MSTPLNPVPLPIGDPITQPEHPFRGNSLAEVILYLKALVSGGFLTQTWLRYFGQQAASIATTPLRLNAVTLTNQGASIAATDISGGALSGGIYEVRFYARIVTVGDVSSSLTVTLDWVDKGQVCSRSFPALTGNLVTTLLSDPSVTIRADGTSPIRYSTTYASNAAGVMKYDLAVVLSRVNA